MPGLLLEGRPGSNINALDYRPRARRVTGPPGVASARSGPRKLSGVLFLPWKFSIPANLIELGEKIRSLESNVHVSVSVALALEIFILEFITRRLVFEVFIEPRVEVIRILDHAFTIEQREDVAERPKLCVVAIVDMKPA
ncbi:MAG TPA: hypothetical protein VIH42_07780, partial [Thermoguttaceae bacterium]